MARMNIDVPLLFQLWADHAVSRQEIASRLGVAVSTVGKLQARYGLPTRPVEKRRRMPQPDPTPEEIQQRAAECRQKDLARKLRETTDETRKRISMEERRWPQRSLRSQA